MACVQKTNHSMQNLKLILIKDRKINIIPQEIGRVILNLINNAFYAVNEKKRQDTAKEYEPTVTVTTKKNNGKIEIKVTDNGNGFRKKYWTKYFSHFLQPSQQDRERDWVYHWLMIL